VNPRWTSLGGIADWKGEFCEELAGFFSIPVSLSAGAWIRAASDGLSMPMTILWGLENLNTDDEWTRKHTLVVHVRVNLGVRCCPDS
jgi:splicing suppressor protein 51